MIPRLKEQYDNKIIMTIKRKISFQEYSEGIEKLAIMVDESGFKPSHIISIARGGLRIGDICSRLFRVRSSYLGVESYEVAEKGKVSDKQKDEVIFSRDISSTTQDYGNNILICDDLVDSGDSLIYTKKFLLDYKIIGGDKELKKVSKKIDSLFKCLPIINPTIP